MAERLKEQDEIRIMDEIRDVVRTNYATAAKAASTGSPGGCGPQGCGCGETLLHEQDPEVYGVALYEDDEREALPDAAKLASLGCGNPTAVAELHEGETVLDLGSGGGIDVLLSARRVGPSGKAFGLDMTDEMLELARRNQREAGVENVEFLKGTIEEVPLPDDSVDVIISNCVINLSADKSLVFREAARVLRPGGRFAVTDIVAEEDMPEEVRLDIEEWSGCIGGALTPAELERGLIEAGLEEVEIRETHRVHEHAGSAIIRARLAQSDGGRSRASAPAAAVGG
jgi:arsenite methyltransferase